MSAPYYEDESVTLHHGDCLDVLRQMPDASVDSVCTDPPYGLEFMGKDWDRFDGGGAKAGIREVEFKDMGQLPDYLGGGQATCLHCGGDKYRATETDRRRRCRCDNPQFPNQRRARSTAFGEWCEQWARECLRVLKPGGHLLAFGGSRTWHRLATAVEDAGFEIRDSIAWLHAQGFPKSLDVSKAIDKAAGAEREDIYDDRALVTDNEVFGKGLGRGIVERRPATPDAVTWQGWGTALKPAFEPIVAGRKPLVGTVAANVLAHGTGALNVDGCRVGTETRTNIAGGASSLQRVSRVEQGYRDTVTASVGEASEVSGRWPTNVVLDGHAAAELDQQSGVLTSGANPTRRGSDKFRDAYGDFKGQEECTPARGAESGGASRFFPTFHYEAKAPTAERPRTGDTGHPTVKPLDLMRWLVRLVTPPGGTVLEPFAGSGTTAEACVIEGFRCIAIEREADYLPLIVARLTKPIQPDMFGTSA